MDMSVKLSLSYPAVQPASAGVDTLAAVPPVVRAPTEAKSADSNANAGKNPESENSDALKTAVQEIQKFVQSARRNLEFSIDEASGKVVVKVIASETGEVVRQLPSAEALKIADSLHNAHSLLFDAKV
jgi:flagellar protein FlaG